MPQAWLPGASYDGPASDRDRCAGQPSGSEAAFLMLSIPSMPRSFGEVVALVMSMRGAPERWVLAL